MVGTPLAADFAGMTVDLEGNDSKGKFLYRTNCRVACHDGEHGDGKARSPMDLMQSEWETIAQNIAKIPCLDKWPANFTEEDVNDVFSYLYGGASDSPTPTS